MTLAHTNLKAIRQPGMTAGAAALQIGGYLNSRTYARVIDLSITNTSGVAITVSVYLRSQAGMNTYIAYNLPVAVGTSQVIAGPAARYTVLASGDSVWASIAGTGGTADITLSVEERAQ